MSDASPLRLSRHDATGALRLDDELKAVYLASHQQHQDDPWYTPEKFWERLEQLYAPIPDFELVVGWIDDRMIGYGFGTPFGSLQTMWDKAIRVFPELHPVSSVEPVYIFREFAVHPHHQGKGYARTIHDALLAERPEPLAYLLVRVGNPVRGPTNHGDGASSAKPNHSPTHRSWMKWQSRARAADLDSSVSLLQYFDFTDSPQSAFPFLSAATSGHLAPDQH